MTAPRRLLATAALAVALALVSTGAAATDRIEFWTVSLKPKFIPIMEALVAAYQAQHPDVQLEWVDYPWDVLQTKLITRIVAGKPPALVNLNVPRADEYAADGLIVPVDALIAPARASYLKAALDDVTFGGKLYGFPFYSNVAVVAYNTTLFEAADLHRAPRSLDEQLAYARQLAARTGKPGYAPLLGSVDGFFLQQGLPVLHANRAAFNTPGHAALVAKLAATYRAGGLLKDSLFAEDNFAAAINAYNSGRLGMLVAPATAMRRIQADAPEVYAVTQVAPAPLGPTGIADGGWLLHFSVPKGVDPALLPAVGAFARYLTNDANQLAFAKVANVFPTTIRAGSDGYFSALPSHPTPSQRAVVAAAQSMPFSHTLYVAGVADYDELRRILVTAVEAGVTGRQQIAPALAEAAAAWDRKLSAQRRY
jgi:putative chitobiose transport system substrate-binding protein